MSVMATSLLVSAVTAFSGFSGNQRLARSRPVLLSAQQPICAPTPCDFPWWTDSCTSLISKLDESGGTRFGEPRNPSGFDPPVSQW